MSLMFSWPQAICPLAALFAGLLCLREEVA